MTTRTESDVTEGRTCDESGGPNDPMLVVISDQDEA